MTNEETIEAVRERARANFSKVYNCAECVTEAILSPIDTGLASEAKKLATGFGGSIGLFGDTCGAVAGAVMAVSAVHGRTELPEGEDRKDISKKFKAQLYGRPSLYRLFNQIPNRLKDKYGSTLCREVTAQWKEDWLCRELITDAAGIDAELALSDKEELATKDFGENVEGLKD